MIQFICGLVLGCMITLVAIKLAEDDSNAKCAKAHNVYTCEYKGGWVPAAPSLK